MTFLNSILNKSKEHSDDPFKHWEINNPLSMKQLRKLLKPIYLDLKQT